ncbi:MAG: Imm52 family immunity protein [Hyalangium sp.]|uniref:Imm52 family immunity protein n=1 Tax=Hyalangium sp. TaxID=2028555 RepID=UPI003899DAC0
MEDPRYIGAYWGARKESAEECARRLAALVQLLAPMDPLFANWFKSAKSLKESLKRPLELELSALTKHVQRCIMRDTRRQPMEDLGFSVWLWNGRQGGNDAWLRTSCGGYSEWVGNNCILEAPDEGPGSERVLTMPIQVAALRAIAAAWDPDWGISTSYALQDVMAKKGDERDWRVGWITYISRRLGRVPPLPAPVRIEPVEELGTLVIVTPEFFSAFNPEHIALAERVRELLDRAGLLTARPVQPTPQ